MIVEESLFSSTEHTLGIEYSTVSDKSLKTLIMDTC